MKHLIFKSFSCTDLFNEFGENKIEERYDTLYEEMNLFLDQNDLHDCAEVNKTILAYLIIDYYYDIKRIKNFHTKIEKPNSEKVIAYTAYWILHRKPIQVKSDLTSSKKISTLNERFVLQYILNYLSERERGSHILLRENSGLKNFSKYMLYYLIYRSHDAQSLEMIITAFLAGQIYEQIDSDISELLHPFDN